jgi:hypothetical protein
VTLIADLRIDKRDINKAIAKTLRDMATKLERELDAEDFNPSPVERREGKDRRIYQGEDRALPPWLRVDRRANRSVTKLDRRDMAKILRALGE